MNLQINNIKVNSQHMEKLNKYTTMNLQNLIKNNNYSD